MSKQPTLTPTASPGTLRAYPAPWKGALLLACRKCQKKLKRDKRSTEAANLKKAMKTRSRKNDLRLRVLQIPCLKLCPKDAVTVCTQRQLAQGTCAIVRTPADLDALYAQCRSEATPRPKPAV